MPYKFDSKACRFIKDKDGDMVLTTARFTRLDTRCKSLAYNLSIKMSCDDKDIYEGADYFYYIKEKFIKEGLILKEEEYNMIMKIIKKLKPHTYRDATTEEYVNARAIITYGYNKHSGKYVDKECYYGIARKFKELKEMAATIGIMEDMHG